MNSEFRNGLFYVSLSVVYQGRAQTVDGQVMVVLKCIIA